MYCIGTFVLCSGGTFSTLIRTSTTGSGHVRYIELLKQFASRVGVSRAAFAIRCLCYEIVHCGALRHLPMASTIDKVTLHD